MILCYKTKTMNSTFVTIGCVVFIMFTLFTIKQNKPMVVKFDVLSYKKSHDSIYVAILTKNRREYMQLQSRSLDIGFKYDLENNARFFTFEVFDDASNEISMDEIMSLYPFATNFIDVSSKVVEIKSNVRANSITLEVFKEFLTRKHDWLLVMDSDLVLQHNWMQKIKNTIGFVDDRTVFTLYNSCMHANIACNAYFCKKKNVGSAGILFPKHAIQSIVDSFDINDMDDFDWGYSKYLTDNGFDILAFRNSLVEHVGLYGSNYPATLREVSEDFDVLALQNDLGVEVRNNLHLRENCKGDKLEIMNGLDGSFNLVPIYMLFLISLLFSVRRKYLKK